MPLTVTLIWRLTNCYTRLGYTFVLYPVYLRSWPGSSVAPCNVQNFQNFHQFLQYPDELAANPLGFLRSPLGPDLFFISHLEHTPNSPLATHCHVLFASPTVAASPVHGLPSPTMDVTSHPFAPSPPPLVAVASPVPPALAADLPFPPAPPSTVVAQPYPSAAAAFEHLTSRGRVGLFFFGGLGSFSFDGGGPPGSSYVSHGFLSPGPSPPGPSTHRGSLTISLRSRGL